MIHQIGMIMNNLLTLNALPDTINLDALYEVLKEEDGWRRRTDDKARTINEFIFAKPCEFNANYEVHVWTGVPTLSSIRLNRGFRILGHNVRRNKNQTHSYDVRHGRSWEIHVLTTAKRVSDEMRGQRGQFDPNYFATEFGQQVRY
jgi:hypothetical protein